LRVGVGENEHENGKKRQVKVRKNGKTAADVRNKCKCGKKWEVCCSVSTGFRDFNVFLCL